MLQDIKCFIKDKWYGSILFLIGIGAYGFIITHYSIGIDDTAISMYFDDGLAPYVGRTTLFLVNKIIPLTKMSPFFVEFVSMLCMLFAATLWCVLWNRICGSKLFIPKWVYVLVAGIFISCPLISEVYVFYLHNGICLAYALTAVALYLLLNALRKRINMQKRIFASLLSALFVSLAVGCYESMMLVYVIGALTLFFLLRILYGADGKEAEFETGVLWWFIAGAVTVAGSLLIRSCVIALLHAVYDFESQFYMAKTSKRGSFLSRLISEKDELIMNVKHFIMRYYVNAVCYLPVRMLVIGYAVLGVGALIFSFLKRDFWLLISYIALPVIPVFMCLAGLDGIAYRTAQYVPVVVAFAMLVVFVMLCKVPLKNHKVLYGCYGLIMAIIVWNQCADLNQWFLADYIKYQNDRDIMLQIARDLQAECDTRKPVVFVGELEEATAVTASSTLSFSDSRWKYICMLSDIMDPTMKEKYYCQHGKGYHFRGSIFYSTINWGINAFDLTPTQLTEFWKYHGYDFIPATDLEAIKEAKQIQNELKMPEYPVDGYIMECEDYIIIHL